MARILLISAARLKEISEIHENVDDKVLQTSIEQMQDIEIERLLGEDLMVKLKSLVSADTVGDITNAAYKTLIEEYIEPCLALFVQEDAVIGVNFKYMAKGIVKREQDHAFNISSAERGLLQRRYREKANFYASKMEEYILDNLSSFTEYDKGCNGSRGNYAGFYFGDE